MKKTIRILGIIILETILILTCVSIGFFMNSSAQGTEQLTINTIALVNLDEGIEIEGEIKYYGIDFIGILEDNFEVTGLEQARKGLDNNIYAAYVIIPGDFSRNVESINNKPQKSNIIFKINNNLDSEVRETVIEDVTDFNNKISTNIEYVYLDAILNGLHSAQDGAGKLLENDLKDLKAVLKFTESSMIADAKYPEQKHMDNSVKGLNIADLYTEMQKVFSSLSKFYKDNETAAQDQYNTMVEETSSISTGMDTLSKSIEAVGNIEQDVAFNLGNTEGIDIYVNEFNSGLKEWKENYDKDILENQMDYMETCQKNVDLQLEDQMEQQKTLMKSHYEIMWNEYNKTSIALNCRHDGHNMMNFDSYNEAKNVILDLVDRIKRLQKEIMDLSASINNNSGIIGTVQLGEINENDYLATVERGLQADLSRIDQEIYIEEIKKNAMLKAAAIGKLVAELSNYNPEKQDDIKKISEDYIPDLMTYEDIEYLIDLYMPDKLTVDVEINKITEDKSDKEESVEGDTVPSEEIAEEIKEEQSKEQKRVSDILFNSTIGYEELDGEDLRYEIADIVLDPISQTIAAKHEEITNDYESLNAAWDNIDLKLRTFSINDLGDEKRKNSIEQSFNTNFTELQKRVGSKEKEYENYVENANKLNNTNLENWEKSIKEANKETSSNVAANIKNIKETREGMNADNSVLMDGLINTLPYTRIGDLENRQVYRYISNPIVGDDLSVAKEKKAEAKEEKNKSDTPIDPFIVFSLISGGGICSIFLLIFVLKKNKKLQEQVL
ncbi:MAG: hypothetical protein NC124_21150 [Clostridium sp.]|nr:hypothetical protein [Clostridium sp.]